MIQISDIIAAGGDANEITETMTTDLSAAFDSVEHELLLKKLAYYGMDGHTMKWLESYLTGRSTYVVVGSGQSAVKTTFYGVPQGSCLGPLLYLIFVNELPSVVNEDYCGEDCHQNTTELFTKDCKKCGYLPVFADDAQFLITNSRRRLNQDRIEEIFTKLKNYFEDNGLQINPTKTSISEHMTRQKRTKLGGTPTDLTVTEKVTSKDGKIQVHDKLITDKSNYRYLGINFSNNGLWDPHIDTGTKPLLQNLRRQLGMLSRLRGCTTSRIRLQLVNSLLLSRVNYMICVWGNSTDQLTNKIQVILNKAARFIHNSEKTTRRTTLMQNCRWMTVNQMTEYASLVQMWKTLRLNVPIYMKDKITMITDDKIQTTPPRLQITARNYRWRTIHYWNNLPGHLRSENNLKIFKTSVKRWLKDRQNPDPGIDDTMST